MSTATTVSHVSWKVQVARAPKLPLAQKAYAKASRKTGFRICLCIATPAVCACTWIDQSNARSANPCLCNNMGRGPCLATTWAKAALRRRPLLVGRLHSVSATTHQTHGRAARLVGSCHDAECQYTMPCTCNCCCPNARHGPKIFGTRPRR